MNKSFEYFVYCVYCVFVRFRIFNSETQDEVMQCWLIWTRFPNR